MGGSIARFVSEKKKVVKIVFSHGEKSSPHLQEKFVRRERFKETGKASRYIGIYETRNLGLKDTKLKQEIQRAIVEKKVKDLIQKYKPAKIYVPSSLDPHPDHQAVNTLVLQVVDSFRKHYPVYAYEVWNVVKETHPQVYVDISKYIDIKLKYIRIFKSQWVYMFGLYLPALFRSLYYGRKHDCKYAELFYKLR